MSHAYTVLLKFTEDDNCHWLTLKFLLKSGGCGAESLDVEVHLSCHVMSACQTRVPLFAFSAKGLVFTCVWKGKND